MNTYNENGGVSVDIICDTYTGIVIEVEEYGEIGELIKGTFSATDCEGHLNETNVTGSFSVIRTE